jgi:hypothetical protein
MKPLTLTARNAQGAFDRVARRLFDGTGRATDSTGRKCLYITPDNRRCAIGHLLRIGDEKLRVLVDDEDLRQSATVTSLVDDGALRTTIDPSLLSDLQGTHDEPSNWTRKRFNRDGVARLAEVAHRWDLSTRVLDKLVEP